MRIDRLAVSLVVAVLVTACATHKTIQVPEGSTPGPYDKPAYLIGTLAVRTEGDNYAPRGFYSLKFRRIGRKEEGILKYAQTDLFQTPVAYETPDTKGGVFAASLLPGEYEFHNIEFFYPGPLAHHRFWAKQDFSIPFTLVSGKALYVGELIASAMWGKNVLQYVPAGGYFVRANKIDRDKALIEAGHPEIKGLPIELLPANMQAPPFVITK